MGTRKFRLWKGHPSRRPQVHRRGETFLKSELHSSYFLTLTFQFNDDYQLNGLGSSVNFLGQAQDGEYHKDIFKVRIIYSHIQLRNEIICCVFSYVCKGCMCAALRAYFAYRRRNHCR
jgi:hypothetical protein